MRSYVMLCVVIAVVAGGCGSTHTMPFEADSPVLAQRSKEAEAEFKAARMLVTELRYDEAAKKLDPLIEAFEAAGAPERAAEATFWLGFCNEKQGRTDKARELYERVARKYPETPSCRQAVERLGTLPAPIALP